MDTRKSFLRKSTIAIGSFLTLGADTFANRRHVDCSNETNGLPFPSSKWTKHGSTVVPTEPWEGSFIQNFNSVSEPLGNGAWRVWYCTHPPKPYYPNIAIAEGVPGHDMKKYPADLVEGEPLDTQLSIGNLPKGWFPAQPVHVKLKNGKHRLYFWAHSSEQRIVRYLVAESEDNRRYRVIDPHRACLYHFHDRAVDFVGTTALGMRLEDKPEEIKRRFPRPAHEPAADPGLICNDATTVYQLEDGSFEMYTVGLVSIAKEDPRYAKNDNLRGYIRVIDRLVSDDGLNWRDRKTVLRPNVLMDPSDLQFYYLNVTYTDKGRIGMLGCFRTKDQTTDIEYCFSEDGISWERPFKHLPWLERGWPPLDQDTLGIFPGASLVFNEDKWWLFYTGCNYTHNRKMTTGDQQSVIMLAELSSIF